MDLFTDESEIEHIVIRSYVEDIDVFLKKLENYPEEFYENGLPKYETMGSSGFDIRADKDYTIPINETVLIKTGFCIGVPKGYELQIRSRSGIALKNSVFVLNGIGTVDADYRNEVGVILHNSGKNSFEIKKGDRVAQGVISPIFVARFHCVDELNETDRKGGFGSTGVL